MKFSVLIPTRNRLELLKYAIASVLRQDYADWEVIVSDNFSEEDIKGYVDSLKDSRIKYSRTDRFVPVTDNWNLALEKISGEYVVMLGDDDCLMKGYFRALAEVIQKYEQPDAIYTGAFQYAYPGALPGFPKGRLHLYTYDLLKMKNEAFWLSEHLAKNLTRRSLDFRADFGYNMQFVMMRREWTQSLSSKGAFFQSPYPDYYAMNVLMLTATRILIYPKPLVTIGISPKSFGFYYFNNREKEGVQFLNTTSAPIIDKLKSIILPGTEMNTSWLVSMEAIWMNYRESMPFVVNYNRYRLMQILKMYVSYVLKDQTQRKDLALLWQKLSLREKMFYALPLELLTCCLRICSVPRIQRLILEKLNDLIKTYPKEGVKTIEGNYYANILEVFEQMDPSNF